MKRIGGLYPQIYSMDNLELADRRARKGKAWQPGVIEHERNREHNLQALQRMLMEKTYRTSEYTRFIINEGKEREIFRLPFWPDRVAHHAIMNVLEPVFTGCFISQTYSCVRGRGIHAATFALRDALAADEPGTKYCLKLDLTKFYPNVNHSILKRLLRRKIKDADLLWLLDEIIDSAPGLPIGNYLSQYFANFYLTYFDHWMKETKSAKYFRYADDMVVLSGSKDHLHALLAGMKEYLSRELGMSIKGNYQVFPVESRGIDFVGYVCYHTHSRLRKGIKKNFARAVARNPKSASLASYMGWARHAPCAHLIKKLIHDPSH